MHEVVIKSGWYLHKSESHETVEFVKKLQHHIVCSYGLCRKMVDIATKMTTKNHLEIIEVVPNSIIIITIITSSPSLSSRSLDIGLYSVPKSAI